MIVPRQLRKDFHGYDLDDKIKEEERRHSIDALKRHAGEKLCKGPETSLKAIYENLLSKGICETDIEFTSTEIRDILTIKFGQHVFNLSFILFPKGNGNRDFLFSVKDTEISKYIQTNNTPDSIADFILAVNGYMPEYCSIKEAVIVREKQKIVARGIALDLIHKNICARLSEKGYETVVNGSEYYDKANVTIPASKDININIDVNLLSEDLYQQIKKLVDALPEKSEI
jgi:hypothetical protein